MPFQLDVCTAQFYVVRVSNEAGGVVDFSIMVYAVIALVGVAIGWLFASYQHAQQKAEQLAEREDLSGGRSA